MTQIFINILNTSVLYILIAYSFKIIYGVTRFFHIAHAISLTLSAYFTYLFTVQYSCDIICGAITSVIVVIIAMLIINGLLYQSMIKRNVVSWRLLVVSLGVYIILQNIISVLWGDNIQTIRGWPVREGYGIGESYISSIQIFTICIGVAILFICWLILKYTNVGKSIRMVTSNSQLCEILGVSQKKTIKWSMIIGTGMVAIAGILIALDMNMSPTMGFNWLIYGVVAMIIGGIGEIRFIILGAILLSSSQHLAAYFLDSKWMNATAYIILIIFLYIKPYGIEGVSPKKADL